MTAFRVELLPAPLAPITPMASPAGTEKLISRTAQTPL